VGDYFAGPNHILPTNGTARFSSPLSVDDFVKKSSVIHYSREALMESGEAIMTLARHEGLEAHARAVQIRMEKEGKRT
jgi:histidinol dehydrogenase